MYKIKLNYTQYCQHSIDVWQKSNKLMQKKEREQKKCKTTNRNNYSYDFVTTKSTNTRIKQKISYTSSTKKYEDIMHEQTTKKQQLLTVFLQPLLRYSH